MDIGSRIPKVIHITTSHWADDVRIFEKECKSLAESKLFHVVLAAPGEITTGFGVHQISIPNPPITRIRRFTSGPRIAQSIIKNEDADLWHFHDPELLPIAYRLSRSGKRVIWDAHEDYVAQFDENGSKQWVKGPFRKIVKFGTRQLIQKIDRHAAGIIAATNTIASRYSNPNTVVVGNEARLETFTSCLPSFDSKQVFFSGSMGHGHLFLQVAEAVAQLEYASLAVAGRVKDEAIWRQAQKILGNRLVHLGWLNRNELVEAINTSSIGLSTYADIPTNRENSPNKLFEFGAAGLPIVATPTESNSFHINRSGAGLLASGFSATDIAVALDQLLSNHDLWTKSSIAGRVWAIENGSWNASEKRLLDLYSKLLNC